MWNDVLYRHVHLTIISYHSYQNFQSIYFCGGFFFLIWKWRINMSIFPSSFSSFFSLSREHPIGDKSFQSYIRQQSEISAHSIWSLKKVIRWCSWRTEEREKPPVARCTYQMSSLLRLAKCFLSLQELLQLLLCTLFIWC